MVICLFGGGIASGSTQPELAKKYPSCRALVELVDGLFLHGSPAWSGQHSEAKFS